ncbi:unnamed protein product [Vitrella brassicaformis CCMP3155]|uniref:Apple domain-containing protein n=1 Tax=Vitrella brassicaformis (strain CCMP3155) TaxID=1169540 RepID=A0A0G4FS69_VITBC|nr:unnamed protein product [Vitrella brassicaformis CCMP3155]|eukprot:CEM17503.1 unnamed protein product [Vitrella brassicaformis CCMP3155]
MVRFVPSLCLWTIAAVDALRAAAQEIAMLRASLDEQQRLAEGTTANATMSDGSSGGGHKMAFPPSLLFSLLRHPDVSSMPAITALEADVEGAQTTYSQDTYSFESTLEFLRTLGIRRIFERLDAPIAAALLERLGWWGLKQVEPDETELMRVINGVEERLRGGGPEKAMIYVPEVLPDYNGDGAVSVMLDARAPLSWNLQLPQPTPTKPTKPTKPCPDGSSECTSSAQAFRPTVKGVKYKWELTTHRTAEETVLYEGPHSEKGIALPVGKHTLSLTVTSSANGSANKTVTAKKSVTVAPIDRLPGVQVFLYDSGTHMELLERWQSAPVEELPNVPSWVGVGRRDGMAIDARNGWVGDSAYGRGCLVRLIGYLDFRASKGVLDKREPISITTTHPLKFTSLHINGHVHNLTQNLVISPHSNSRQLFDVRFSLQHPPTDPLSLQFFPATSPLTPSLTPAPLAFFRNETAFLPRPFINHIEPNVGRTKTVIRIHGRGMLTPQQKGENTILVHFDDDSAVAAEVSEMPDSYVEVEVPPWHEPSVKEVNVWVETQRGGSNKKMFVYEGERGKGPVAFDRRVVAQVDHPTVTVWGPDQLLYVGSLTGHLHVFSFPANASEPAKEVRRIASITQTYGLGHSIMGLTFDPYADESSGPRLLVSHSVLQLYGEGCGYLKEGQLLPYNSTISELRGWPTFDDVRPFTERLPLANGGEQTNHLAFDFNGDLYISQPSMTNGGIPTEASGCLPESPLTAAVLHAKRIHNTTQLAYINQKTESPVPSYDQSAGSNHALAPDSAKWLDVHASGFRSPRQLVWTTQGQLWVAAGGITDNGGMAMETECTLPSCPQPLQVTPPTSDCVAGPLAKGSHWGAPNSARGQKKADTSVGEDDEEMLGGHCFTTTRGISGLTEVMGSCFDGQLRGRLIASYVNEDFGGLLVVHTRAKDTRQPRWGLNTHFDSLAYGPGCRIIGVDKNKSRVEVLTPKPRAIDRSGDEDVSVPVLYDVWPWRGRVDVSHHLRVGGAGLNGRGGVRQVKVGSRPARLVDCTETTIDAILPPMPASLLPPPPHVFDLTVIFDDDTSVLLTAAFRIDLLPLSTDGSPCPAGMYLGGDGRCMLCDSVGCERCGRRGECRRCMEGYVLVDQDGFGMCQACPIENCVKCDAGSVSTLASRNGTCTRCARGHYLSSDAGQCLPCTLDDCHKCADHSGVEPPAGVEKDAPVCRECADGLHLTPDHTCQRCYDIATAITGEILDTLTPISSPSDCITACRERDGCVAYEYRFPVGDQTCVLWSSVDSRSPAGTATVISGKRECDKVTSDRSSSSSREEVVSPEEQQNDPEDPLGGEGDSALEGEEEETGCFLKGVEYVGGDILSLADVRSAQLCQHLCLQHSQCQHWSFYGLERTCHLKKEEQEVVERADGEMRVVSGPKECDGGSRR